MKRNYLSIFTLVFTLQVLWAQNETDVLRFSQNFNMGTARSVGMSGAVGALGGDFTSVILNPANLGIYRSSEFTLTPLYSWNVTSSRFLNNTNEDIKRNFSIANIGYVFHHDLNRESGWISTSIAFGYNMLNNYNQRVFMAGINNLNSFLDDFATLSDDQNSSEFLFYKDLAFQDSLLVEGSTPGTYTTDFKIDGYGQYQERLLTTSGTTGELFLSFGANYNHSVYLGALLGLHRVSYDHTYIHTEIDQEGTIYYVEKFIFTEDQRTRGYGFNMKLGAIYRPYEFLRIGAAFHTGSIYFLEDQFTTDLTAYYDDYNPRTASSPFGENSYRIITPSKLLGSATFTFRDRALLSLDYEYINFNNGKIESKTDRYTDENNAVKVMYKSASNIKAGGEVRLNPFYLRAGYAFYGSPYAMVDPNADEKHHIISAGTGIRTRKVFVDLAFSQNSFDQAYYMYPSQVANGAINKSKGKNFLVTIGYKF